MMSPKSISTAQAVIITTSRAAREVIGKNDLRYRMGAINYSTSPFDWMAALDGFLVNGIYSGLIATTNVAISSALARISDKSKFTYYNSLGFWAQKSAEWVAKRLAFEAEIDAARVGLGLGSIPIIGNKLGNALLTGFPARSALSNRKEATEGQHFQFFFRSLKPSIWESDREQGSLANLNPLSSVEPVAPKGILRMPPAITQFTESYNPTWQQQNILGSAQKTHKYQYTDRTVNLSVELYSNTLAELRYNIWRLNWLADHTYGKLTNFNKAEQQRSQGQGGLLSGFLGEGGENISTNSRFTQTVEYKEFPFIKITVGTVLIEVPCYITSLSLNYHMDAPWELGDDLKNRWKGKKELQWPHWITVTLAFNVLYDTLDPTTKSFYNQVGTNEKKALSIKNLLKSAKPDPIDYMTWGK
jgi:hypothetical protein